ncbi:SET domain-containing protein-lysine N-methyltransferase [Fluviispira vulneris]|uniref:SET domain-containing protein-lysine N-methyltransferase n=1 Tax=Fluviispira vulneris TaxID=2763012 RepID=UPI001644A03B|nr:SET domain-containing protein [Fluviispira vulneris]
MYINDINNYKQEFIFLDLSNNYFEVKKSQIHGFGLYALKYFQKNMKLGPSLIHKSIDKYFIKYLGNQFNPKLKWDYSQTSATRFINHSLIPNAKLYMKEPSNGIIYAKSLKNIHPGDEVTLNYIGTLLMAEDHSDDEVIRYYCGVLKVSKENLFKLMERVRVNHLEFKRDRSYVN